MGLSIPVSIDSVAAVKQRFRELCLARRLRLEPATYWLTAGDRKTSHESGVLQRDVLQKRGARV